MSFQKMHGRDSHVMKLPSWEHFHHESDVGVRGYGCTLTEAFEQASLAMIAVVTDPGRIESRKSVDISLSAPDDEFLLAGWLNHLIYEMSVTGLIFGKFQINLEDHSLQAKAWGEPVDKGKHQPAVELKGATLTELKVCQSHHGCWMAQCVVDV